MDANVLNLRMLSTTPGILQKAYDEEIDLKCGGIKVHSNTFTQNVGCKNNNGVTKVYCFDSAKKSEANVVYHDFIDS